jgi:hypothetical protein
MARRAAATVDDNGKTLAADFEGQVRKPLGNTAL